jgi:glycosyltransferase involved in cell wall biosynthesis
MNTDEQARAIIFHSKARDVLWDGVSIPTNTEVSLAWSDAIKLSRILKVEIKDSAKQPYNPSWFVNSCIFGFIGDADNKSGFGNCTYNLIKYSSLNGYDVRWVGRGYDIPGLGNFSKKIILPDIGMVWHEQPNEKWDNSPFEKNIAVIPFETTRIPASWVQRINRFDALFCVSNQNIKMMRDSGVVIPIELIHWGIDESLFYPLHREETNLFTFGTMGSLSIRKGTDLLVRAFSLAFPEREFPDVRLICKTSNSHFLFMSKDKRMSVQMTAVEHDDLMQNFFKKIDVFVLPTRGEGAGLPVLEANATGIPAITTGWSGVVDYSCPATTMYLDYKMVPATEFSEKLYKEDCGEWAEPDINDLIAKMRYSYFHRDEIKEAGRLSSQWVKDNMLWKDKIHEFLNGLDKYL